MAANKSHAACKACGGPGGDRPWHYCQDCLDKHAAGDLPLGSCQKCVLFVAPKEEKDVDPARDA